VYPSGAFVGLLRLEQGENRFTLTAMDSPKVIMTKEFLVVRKPPLKSTPRDTLAIDSVLVEPSQDLWLNEGDLLRVQIKGTPGCRATFLDGMPMNETPPSDPNGLQGIYRGAYRVRAGDVWESVPVQFILADSGGRSVVRSSRGRLTASPGLFPMVGLARGERPYLNYGLGEDRLGGAKLSFINAGVRLTLTGKTGDQYRVALAENQEAWIPEHQVEVQMKGTPPPFSLAGSWNVYGENNSDYVTIALSDKLPYASFVEGNPARIQVDLFGAVSNSNWITQHLTAREILNVSYRQVEKNVLRITVELKHRQVWGYALGYRGNTLVLKVRRQPEKLDLDHLTIMLDAGHGGTSDGAIGSTGAREKDVNLATVFHLKRLLEAEGAKVLLTRRSDSSSSTSERVKAIIASEADLLISIHSNAIGNTTDPEATRGASTYYRHQCFRPLSQAIYARILKTGLVPFGNVGGFNFLLNSPTELPNVLVELAFMSNPEDEMRLLDDKFRKELAERIMEGVEDFLENNEE
jgi:N-acetylmuramoyl-L-alanine amidase